MSTQLTRDAIAHFHELLATKFPPESWWSEHVDEVMRHWVSEPQLGAFVLRPRILDEDTYAATCASIQSLARGLAIAVERLANDEPLRRALGIPPYIEQLLEIDRAHGKPTCMGRFDGIATADGRFAVIEFNSEPQTAALQYELERSYDRLPIAQEFARRFAYRTVDLYDRVYDVLAERGRENGSGAMPCVAVIDKALWRSPHRAASFRPLFASAARGCPVVLADPEELDYRGGALTMAGQRVDMVAFVGWDLVINARKRVAKILKAVADGAVGVFAGLSRGLLASYKVVFEMLSSREYCELFDRDTNAALESHVAWTRVLRERTTDRAGTAIDLVPFVAGHREQLVIKPAGGGGGGNVTVGRSVDDATWASALRRGVEQHWIVQDFIEPETESFPVVDRGGRIQVHDLRCELTPYVWNGRRVDGVLSRVVEGFVVHDPGDRPIGVASGIETATWIVRRRV